MTLTDLRTKIYADGADLSGMLAMYREPYIKGFTTNPTLMRKAGVTDYEAFAKQALEIVGDRPISFEVFADDFAEMGREARVISSWADNVYTKIPVTDTSGTADKIEGFENMVRQFGLVEMVRTGEIAIARGKSQT